MEPEVVHRTSKKTKVTKVRLQLVQPLRLLANQGAVVPVRCQGKWEQLQQPLLVEAEVENSLTVVSAVVMPPEYGIV